MPWLYMQVRGAQAAATGLCGASEEVQSTHYGAGAVQVRPYRPHAVVMGSWFGGSGWDGTGRGTRTGPRQAPGSSFSIVLVVGIRQGARPAGLIHKPCMHQSV